MKKTSSLIDFQFTIPSLIILFILFTPLFACADMVFFYRCIDKSGTETMSNYILPEATCTRIGTFEKLTDAELMKYEGEKVEREKQRAADYEKEKQEKKTAVEIDTAALEACYARASRDRTSCHYATPADLMRCDYNYQQERNQCLQLYRR
jgi:hypothetical protein